MIPRTTLLVGSILRAEDRVESCGPVTELVGIATRQPAKSLWKPNVWGWRAIALGEDSVR